VLACLGSRLLTAGYPCAAERSKPENAQLVQYIDLAQELLAILK